MNFNYNKNFSEYYLWLALALIKTEYSEDLFERLKQLRPQFDDSTLEHFIDYANSLVEFKETATPKVSLDYVCNLLLKSKPGEDKIEDLVQLQLICEDPKLLDKLDKFKSKCLKSL